MSNHAHPRDFAVDVLATVVDRDLLVHMLLVGRRQDSHVAVVAG